MREEIVFYVEAIDEDGDDLNVTWKDGDVTLGTGNTFGYKKLKPGKRIIRLLVSDGEATVENEFTVVIKKKEESPSIGLMWAIIAMAMAGVVAIRSRDRYR